MLEALRKLLSSWLRGGAPASATRMYAAAKSSRLSLGFGGAGTSADSELASSLRSLRSRSRQLVRDAAYAKRARVIVVNNVIGPGVGMQAQAVSERGTPRRDVNDAIERAWARWCRASNCHTGGALHFHDLERALLGQVFEAGEVLVRKHYARFGESEVPFALEVIEAERLVDDYSAAPGPAPLAPGAEMRMGIEVDRFGRAIAYWVRERHASETHFSPRSDRIERVPAEQMMHLRLIDRWPQTRGEPWLHAVARKLNDMDGYSEAEIIAARGAANYVAAIEAPESDSPVLGERSDDGQREIELEPGMQVHLAPGEKLNFVAPNRPNTALDPFMRYMLREVAAGIGVSYESLSRDYSQSNYSSSRLALLDDRDLWRVLQQWWIRSFREPLHREWLRQAVLARAVPPIRVEEYASNPEKFEAVRFKPRGWGWVDPTKEVEAYKEALKAGFTTRADIIAATADGRDIEDIDEQRRRELDDAAESGLSYDTDPVQYAPAAPPEAAPPAEPADRSVTVNVAPAQVSVTAPETRIENHLPPPVVHMKSPTVNVEGPVVNVQPPQVNFEPQVHVAAPEVRVDVPQQPAPVVNVEAPLVTVEPQIHVATPEVRVEAPSPPAPIVNVEPPAVTVVNERADIEQIIERDRDGEITRIVNRKLTQR